MTDNKIDINTINDMKAAQQAKITQDFDKRLAAFDRVAKKTAARLAHAARTNPMLAEALYTNPIAPQANSQPGTPMHMGGMQMGHFGVYMIPNDQGKVRYDIANETTGQKLVGGLHLEAGANTIVKLLNKGYSFYSPQIKQILEMEAGYVKNYNDALSFKKKIKNNPMKDAILEARFEDAKTKAVEIKEKLINFTSKL